MVKKEILESAIRVLVEKEIEEAGRRVGQRLAEAFGNLAKLAKDSVEISQDIQATNGAVQIRVVYDINAKEVVDTVRPSASDEALADDLAADNPVDGPEDVIAQAGLDGDADVYELEISPDDIEMIEEGPEKHIDTV